MEGRAEQACGDLPPAGHGQHRGDLSAAADEGRVGQCGGRWQHSAGLCQRCRWEKWRQQQQQQQQQGGAGHFTKEELRELFTLEQTTACDTLDLLLRSNSPLSAKWLAAATTDAAAAGSTITGSATSSSAAVVAAMSSGGGRLAAGIADDPLREVTGMCEGVTFVYHEKTGFEGGTEKTIVEARAGSKGLASKQGAQHGREGTGGCKEEEEIEEEEGNVVPVIKAATGGGSGGAVETGMCTERVGRAYASEGTGGGAAGDLLTFDTLRAWRMT
ncbi:hypothetical protein CLOM_g17657 [Closterium sp. NIES-68]|nr:hypothetical protein CLOM_g17657 [Closterium sp. NIES-68]